MSATISETDFTCTLVTIRSSKSFEEVTSAIESTFAMMDLERLARLTAEGDQSGIQEYVRQAAGENEFSIFFKLDQGSTQRLAGIPIDCRFYLLGNAVTVNGIFEFGAMAGLGAPVRFCVSRREGEETRIDVDRPTAFFSQFPEFEDSPVPAVLDEQMIAYLIAAAE